ncbi:MAG: PASTA domain-containing protein [Bacteroidetes bacterium]|nr:PASTA domain-containing protein [Bacteroidota bacterium]
MSLKKFILSRLFVRHFALAAAIFTAFMLVLLVWLNIYTRHGQARVVPDFVGKTPDEAVEMSQKLRFRFFVTDSVFTGTVPKGTIAEQNPAAGHRVKKHRRINITINAFNPEMASVPNLVGLSLRQALATITTAGFEPGKLSYTPDISVDLVLRQMHNGVEVAQGETIQKGSVIDLVLGSGLSSRRTRIPSLVGIPLDRARSIILGSSLNLGTFVYDNTILTALDSATAFVYKQNPEFNEEATLQVGSIVYLWLTVDSLKLPVDSTLLMTIDTVGGAGIVPLTMPPDSI